MRRSPSLPNAVMTEIQRLFIQRGLKAGDRLPPDRLEDHPIAAQLFHCVPHDLGRSGRTLNKRMVVSPSVGSMLR